MSELSVPSVPDRRSPHIYPSRTRPEPVPNFLVSVPKHQTQPTRTVYTCKSGGHLVKQNGVHFRTPIDGKNHYAYQETGLQIPLHSQLKWHSRGVLRQDQKEMGGQSTAGWATCSCWLFRSPTGRCRGSYRFSGTEPDRSQIKKRGRYAPSTFCISLSRNHRAFFKSSIGFPFFS